MVVVWAVAAHEVYQIMHLLRDTSIYIQFKMKLN